MATRMVQEHAASVLFDAKVHKKQEGVGTLTSHEALDTKRVRLPWF